MDLRKKSLMSGIAARLKAIRKARGDISRPQMAAALGIARTTYSKCELAKAIPSFNSQIILSEKFDVSMDWLLFNKGTMNLSTVEKALHTEKTYLEEINDTDTIQTTPHGKEKISSTPSDLPHAVKVTAPEIIELLLYMKEFPGFKHLILSEFYEYKQKKSPADSPPTAA